MAHIVFSHGKESGPWGGKIRHLADVALRLGCTFETLDYQGMHNPDLRAQKLLDHLTGSTRHLQNPLILVGSSMGAYVSLVAARHFAVQGLFLLAPALGLENYAEPMIAPHALHTEVVHGWHDHLIPPETVMPWAKRHRCTLHLVNDGHRLLQVMPETGAWFRDFLLAQTRAFVANSKAGGSSSPTPDSDHPTALEGV